MNKEYWEYLYINKSKDEFLLDIGFKGLSSDTIVDFNLDYSDIQNAILSDPQKSFLFPLSEIPFERAENVQLAALSRRINTNFHLKNKSEIKNISFFNENQTIFYSEDNAALYISELNSKVQLSKIPISELDSKTLSIHQGAEWSEHSLTELHPQEFTPRPADGVVCVVCHKSNHSLRKQVVKLHNEDSMMLSNIERSIVKELNNENIIACHIYNDENMNFHGIICQKQKDNTLNYTTISQSTTHKLAHNLIEKLQSN